MSDSIRLIVGLGNPGKEYADTRHNAGAWFVQELCKQHNIELKFSKKLNGFLNKVNLYNKDVYFLIPNSYMNLSGQVVSGVANYYNLPSKSILIAHDDIDLSVGIVRLKSGGGHGGHNGLRDVISALKSEDFLRLRIGVGHPGNKDLVSDYVTCVPSRSDRAAINAAIDESLLEAQNIINGNLMIAMNNLHNFGSE